MTILKIYFDFKSPESYLAFHQTQKISFPDSIQIEWKPFLTKNKTRPLPKDDETKGETHIRIREEHKKFINLKYSEILNIPMRYPEEDIQTDLALAITSHLKKESEKLHNKAFYCSQKHLSFDVLNNFFSTSA